MLIQGYFYFEEGLSVEVFIVIFFSFENPEENLG
jgi:hypothetical protein